jgi:hypothetical protein
MASIPLSPREVTAASSFDRTLIRKTARVCGSSSSDTRRGGDDHYAGGEFDFDDLVVRTTARLKYRPIARKSRKKKEARESPASQWEEIKLLRLRQFIRLPLRLVRKVRQAFGETVAARQ